ncbi:MAG: FAD-dependent thymidylate synthase [Thermoleophilia bacterium]|nr:FAD-dependent thymidylate synthase [Thermoleophilia bacterium]
MKPSGHVRRHHRAGLDPERCGIGAWLKFDEGRLAIGVGNRSGRGTDAESNQHRPPQEGAGHAGKVLRSDGTPQGKVVSSDLSDAERARLAPYVTDVDGPVFALTNLPETVKGALFARYSRSPKSLRRLLLDEFMPDAHRAAAAGTGAERADALFDRVLAQYGDDSVAQLGAAHVAVEGASNILTKVLQWGRIASYLEQSTRYIAYTDRPDGRWRYHTPSAVAAHPDLATEYRDTLDRAFERYRDLVPVLTQYWDTRVPMDDTPAQARTRAIHARALDSLRGMLPAATTSNMGIFASGQAYEALLTRLMRHPLSEARECGERMLVQLRQVIPAFLTRVDRPDRGVRHAEYLAERAAATRDVATRGRAAGTAAAEEARVTLLDFDPDGEERVLTHALWPDSMQPLADVRDRVRTMSAGERRAVLTAYTGNRADRRHRPGRALEATTYTFEIVCDYGAYRDLQRHRILSLQAQALTPYLGWALPQEVEDAGVAEPYRAVMAESAGLYAALLEATPAEAPYAVSLAHRMRFTLILNAREAMHLIELRSQPQGHASYRRVAQLMHDAIRDVAGHHDIADMMSFVDHSDSDVGRLAAERRSQERAEARSS